jgi:amidase
MSSIMPLIKRLVFLALVAFSVDATDTTGTSWTNPFPVKPCHGIDIQDITVLQLQAHFAKGSLTSVQLAQCYVDRIRETNSYVHHVIEVNPDWKTIAQSLDDERTNGSTRGPLHGIPVLTKDNIATDDKQLTTGTDVLRL